MKTIFAGEILNFFDQFQGRLPLVGEQARLDFHMLGKVCGRATRPYGRMKFNFKTF